MRRSVSYFEFCSVLISLLFSIPTYWMINLDPRASHFFRYISYYFLNLLTAESLIVLIVGVWPNFVGGLVLSASVNGLFMACSGFVVEPNVLNVFWRYTAYWVNYQRFTFDLLLQNEFDGRIYNCDSTCRCEIPSSLNSECKIAGADVLIYRGMSRTKICHRANDS